MLFWASLLSGLLVFGSCNPLRRSRPWATAPAELAETPITPVAAAHLGRSVVIAPTCDVMANTPIGAATTAIRHRPTKPRSPSSGPRGPAIRPTCGGTPAVEICVYSSEGADTWPLVYSCYCHGPGVFLYVKM